MTLYEIRVITGERFFTSEKPSFSLGAGGVAKLGAVEGVSVAEARRLLPRDTFVVSINPNHVVYVREHEH